MGKNDDIVERVVMRPLSSLVRNPKNPRKSDPQGLTENYIENKLLNKSLVTVIQYPSAIRASKQIKNGGRLHHLITYRNLGPRILRIKGGNDNIAWDTYPEDVPFTNEPKR